MKRTLLFLLLLVSKELHAQNKIYIAPRLGHDYLLMNHSEYNRMGRYIFEGIKNDNIKAPTNWYAGLGVFNFNPQNKFRYMIDVLYKNRAITHTQQMQLRTDYKANLLQGKIIGKIVSGGTRDNNHFYIGFGGAYNHLLNEKIYENDKLRTFAFVKV